MEQLKSVIAKLRLEPQQNMMAEYEKVELTEEETAKAILEAKINKYWIIQDQLEAERKLQMKNELKRPWTFDEMKLAATKRANELVRISGYDQYIFDQYSTAVFDLLCLYFTNDPRFEQDGRSLKKGILLQGNVGVGKTDLLRAFEQNKVQCFITITADEVSSRVKEHGAEYWGTYTGFVPGHGGTPKYFLQPNVGWMIDDIGTENKVNDYGNSIDPLYAILAERYKQKVKIPFNSMHFTTNLTGDQLEQRYDYRFRSRVREMFNVIVLKGIDRRM